MSHLSKIWPKESWGVKLQCELRHRQEKQLLTPAWFWAQHTPTASSASHISARALKRWISNCCSITVSVHGAGTSMEATSGVRALYASPPQPSSSQLQEQHTWLSRELVPSARSHTPEFWWLTVRVQLRLTESCGSTLRLSLYLLPNAATSPREKCLASSHTESYRGKADRGKVNLFPAGASTCSSIIKFERSNWQC